MSNNFAAAGSTPRWTWPVIGALMLLHIAPYPFATVLLDTSRDLSQAWGIVQGEVAWLGPRIDDRVHLGPLWFWLLAPMLGLTKSVAATLAFEGVLASLKFPLAYGCGRRLVDARFGLLWAVALALPGWNALQSMFPTHVNLVEATMFGALLPLIALWQRGPGRAWLVYGLMQGLALHAHPSTVLVVPLALAVFWRRRVSWLADLPWLAGGVVLAIAPFVPMLLHEAVHGWPMVASLGQGGSDGWRAVVGAPAFAWGVFVQGPVAALASAPLIAYLLVVVVMASLYGWWALLRATPPSSFPRVSCKGLWWLPVIAVLAFAMLAALRERTPFYMVYAWLPFGAAVLAGAWWAGLRSRGGRVLAGMAIGMCVGGAVSVAVLQLRSAHDGLAMVMSGSVSDVRRVSEPRELPLLPAVVVDRWGHEACADRREVIVHGDLALLADASLALGARMACNGGDRVFIGGGADSFDARHIAGLTPGQHEHLFGAVADWSSVLSTAPLRVVASRGSTPVAAGGLLQLRPRSTSAPERREIEFLAPRDAAVSIGLPFAPYDAARIEHVSAEGMERSPVLQGASVRVYRCEGCERSVVSWRVTIRSSEPERLDIVLLTAPAAAASRG